MSRMNASGVLTKISISLNRKGKNKSGISGVSYCIGIVTSVRLESVPCNVGSCNRKGYKASPPVSLSVWSWF